MIPAGLKNQILPLIQNGFVLKRSLFQNCLELYPRSEWDAIAKELNGLSRFNREHANLTRSYTAGVKLIDLDNSGRLLIPKDLLVHSGITKDVVMASFNGTIEIWDKERYEQAINDPEVDAAALAEKHLGKINGGADGSLS